MVDYRREELRFLPQGAENSVRLNKRGVATHIRQ